MNKQTHHLLVAGYLRTMQSNHLNIPNDVLYLILYYHPSYLIYGIGKYIFNNTYSYNTHISKLCDDTVSVCKAFESFVFRTITNEIYMFGQTTKKLDIIQMYSLLDNKPLQLIIAGSITSLVIADNANKLIYGKIYDDNCEFDLIHQTILSKIYDVENKQIIKKICCTSYSTMLLLQHGSLYYHKSGSSQLKKPINVPKIIDMETSSSHGLFITINNNLYVVGDNNRGQLGLNVDSNHWLANFTQNSFFDDKIICKVICNHNHSCIICKNGMCYLMGDNCYGQTAPKKEGKTIEKPYLFQNVYKDLKIIDGAVGYFHSILLTKKRYIYGFGLNNDNQICAGNVDVIKFAKLISYKEIGIDNMFEKIVKIMATQVNTLIITGFIYESNGQSKMLNGNKKRKLCKVINESREGGLKYMKTNNGNKLSL